MGRQHSLSARERLVAMNLQQLVHLFFSRTPASSQRATFKPAFDRLEDRLVPSFSVVGGTHLIVGAETANDTFRLTAVQGGKPVVELNGVIYMGNMSAITEISYDGCPAGTSTAILTDTTGMGAILKAGHGSATLTGANYVLDLSDTPNIVAFGDNTDQATLYGSQLGKNTYMGSSTESSLFSSMFINKAFGFGAVYAYSARSDDVGYLYGSTHSQNHYVATAQNAGQTPYSAIMRDTGLGLNPQDPYYNQAIGFRHVFGHSGTSADVAEYRGSKTLTNAFVSNPAWSRMSATTYDFEGFGFAAVTAFAGTVTDTAFLHGSTSETNTLVSIPANGAHLPTSTLTGSTYADEAVGFRKVYAYAGTAQDVAQLTGTHHQQTATDSYVWGTNMWGDLYWVDAHGFN
jgi:hypothetical protein